MSLLAQVSLSLALGAAVAMLGALLSHRPRTVGAMAWNALIGLYFAAFALDLLHPADGAVTDRYRTPVVLLIGFAGLAVLVRDLILNWRDEDALAEAFDNSQGYIARRHALPARTRAVGTVALLGLSLAGFAALALWKPA